MIEVLFALAKQLGHSEEAVLVHQKAKREERGGFDRGLFLTQILPRPSP
jgi:predicted house-cleaning noncanonical NTP pyrophosphatase (MazG superfamily)